METAALLKLPQVERELHAQPNLGAVAQQPAKAHRQICGDRALLVEDFRYRQPGYAEALGEILLSHPQVREHALRPS